MEDTIEENSEMKETLPETNLTEIVGGETKHVRKLMALQTDPLTVSSRLTLIAPEKTRIVLSNCLPKIHKGIRADNY